MIITENRTFVFNQNEEHMLETLPKPSLESFERLMNLASNVNAGFIYIRQQLLKGGSNSRSFRVRNMRQKLS